MAEPVNKRSLDKAHETAMKQTTSFEKMPFWVLFSDALGAPGKAGAICLQFLKAGIQAYLEAEEHRARAQALSEGRAALETLDSDPAQPKEG